MIQICSHRHFLCSDILDVGTWKLADHFQSWLVNRGDHYSFSFLQEIKPTPSSEQTHFLSLLHVSWLSRCLNLWLLETDSSFVAIFVCVPGRHVQLLAAFDLWTDSLKRINTLRASNQTPIRTAGINRCWKTRDLRFAGFVVLKLQVS